MIVQHKITLEIKEKLTSFRPMRVSALCVAAFAYFQGGRATRSTSRGMRPISQYVYREGEHIRWVVNLLNDEAADAFRSDSRTSGVPR